jgi:large subunit ribosomal protein L3
MNCLSSPVQVKTEETDGYTSLQLGVGEAKAKRVKISAKGHFDRAGVTPKRKLGEFRVSPDCMLPVGFKLSALHFVPGQVSSVELLPSYVIALFLFDYVLV